MQYIHRRRSLVRSRIENVFFPAVRHEGYADSLPSHKRIEDAFGWAKTIGGFTEFEESGRAETEAALTFRMIAYDLIRLAKPLDMAT